MSPMLCQLSYRAEVTEFIKNKAKKYYAHSHDLIPLGFYPSLCGH